EGHGVGNPLTWGNAGPWPGWVGGMLPDRRGWTGPDGPWLGKRRFPNGWHPAGTQAAALTGRKRPIVRDSHRVHDERGARLDGLGQQVDHVAGHGQVDVTGQLDESVHEVELAGSP